jgi:cellulose synthase/poly-beta-1,6-N-acetylglucosamine synthase-like glycosyltransferase
LIIQILSNLFEEGYLHRDKYSVLSAFFAGANVAFRKQALDQVGYYDPLCYCGEDQDMTLRIARAGWELYFEPKAQVRHKNKMTLKSFVRKWYDYGYHHPYIFKKHGSPGFHIFYSRSNKKLKNSGTPMYNQLFGMRFPCRVNIFLTSFLIMHILAVLAIIMAIGGLVIPAIVAGLLAVAIFVLYFKGDFAKKKIGHSLGFVFFRYIANLALLWGGFRGGIHFRMFYISATLDYAG